jgi:hypothetical protein
LQRTSTSSQVSTPAPPSSADPGRGDRRKVEEPP